MYTQLYTTFTREKRYTNQNSSAVVGFVRSYLYSSIQNTHTWGMMGLTFFMGFYKLFYDFNRWIRWFYTILIIWNSNFSRKGQNSAFRLIQRKAFTSLIYTDSKMYSVNAFLCTSAALQVVHPGNKTVSRKNLRISNLYNRRLYYNKSMDGPTTTTIGFGLDLCVLKVCSWIRKYFDDIFGTFVKIKTGL